MISKVDVSERFAKLWRSSREDGHRSQEYMAKALGVSKKTVQNWESGLSSPSQIKGFEWFDVLGLNPLPYYMELIHPNDFMKDNYMMPDITIKNVLVAAIEALPLDVQRKCLYILCGAHGSSPVAMTELTMAYLQTPLHDRVAIAQAVAINYELAKATGAIRNPNEIQPDMNLLTDAIKKGKIAAIEGKNGYTSLFEDDEVEL